jgi:hypothetical protein
MSLRGTGNQISQFLSGSALYYLICLPFVLSLGAGLVSGQNDQDSAYQGPEYREGVSSFGPDSVDLLMLGLNVRQELSPKFSVNGLEFQVVANYAGTGTDTMLRPAYAEGHSRHSYFALTTVWGSMGAGWSVHMGKLLSSGRTERLRYFFSPQYIMNQCGFPEDGCACAPDPNSDQLAIENRRLFNTVVEPSGIRHPMYDREVKCYVEEDIEQCKWMPKRSTDYSWIRAELDDEWACHSTTGWRTPDGTHYGVRPDGLVSRISDLSGNWVDIEYFDEEAEFPPWVKS